MNKVDTLLNIANKLEKHETAYSRLPKNEQDRLRKFKEHTVVVGDRVYYSKNELMNKIYEMRNYN